MKFADADLAILRTWSRPPSAVSIMTGIPLRAASDLSFVSISTPSMTGIVASRRKLGWERFLGCERRALDAVADLQVSLGSKA